MTGLPALLLGLGLVGLVFGLVSFLIVLFSGAGLESDLAWIGTNLVLGVQDIRFEVSDVAGNTTVVLVNDVDVTFVGCDQRFTKPSGTAVTLAQKDDLQPAVAGLHFLQNFECWSVSAPSSRPIMGVEVCTAIHLDHDC